MARLYASGSCVFTKASDALEKYLKDFETSTGIDLVQRSHSDWACVPPRPPLPDDQGAALLDRIGASADAGMVPYLVQKMAERAVSFRDLSLDPESEEETEESSMEEEKDGFVCPPQPIIDYSSSPPSLSPPSYSSLYADLRRLKEQSSNRLWPLSPNPPSARTQAKNLLRDLQALNARDSPSHASEQQLHGTFSLSPIERLSLIGSQELPSSHDSGMISPKPPGGASSPPEWAVSEWRRDRRPESPESLASCTSRISEPKILSLNEKERIRVRLYELDTLPLPVTVFR